MSAPYVPANTTGSAAIVALAWIFPSIASLTIALRILARKIHKIALGPDDWVILAATIPLWGHTAVILWSVYLGGVGHHIDTLQPSNISQLFKSITTVQFSFGLSLGFIKTAIVLLLTRIFVTPGFRKAAWVVIGYIVCWTLMCILIGAAMCRPFSLNWDKAVQGTCGDQLAAYVAIAVSDIIGDLLIIALPMRYIWQLHQKRSTKFLLSGVFALGAFDIVVAILRIIYLVQLMRTDDYTWTAVNCWIWSVLEPSIAALVACGPTLKPLFDSACSANGKASNSGGSQTTTANTHSYSAKITTTTSSSSTVVDSPTNTIMMNPDEAACLAKFDSIHPTNDEELGLGSGMGLRHGFDMNNSDDPEKEAPVSQDRTGVLSSEENDDETTG